MSVIDYNIRVYPSVQQLRNYFYRGPCKPCVNMTHSDETTF